MNTSRWNDLGKFLKAGKGHVANVSTAPGRELVAEDIGPSRRDVDQREERLFRALDDDNDDAVLARDLKGTLRDIGLLEDDQRLCESMAAITSALNPNPKTEEENRRINKSSFCLAIRHNILLIERALQGRMVVPDFAGFEQRMAGIFDRVRAENSGVPADYIPQLNVQGEEADRFGVALCTTDGQRASFGDARKFFTVQSTSKPITYALAVEEHGSRYVHEFVGHEPSGVGFNELTLNRDNQPHNPMINAGAIMTASLVGLTDKRRLIGGGEAQGGGLRGWSGRRFDHVLDRWKALCGNQEPRFSTSVFLSERETADRNFALAYFMRENGAFPDDVDMHDVLEFYLQCCAIEVNAEMMSVIAATFANGGICPVTGERVLQTDTVRNCLSLMSGCGMYDFSGEFAFTIGLPAKSGVSGAMMVVIPNVMGFCVWSPRLDALGNSVRGVAFCRELVRKFNFHNYDDLTGSSRRMNPRLNPIQVRAREVNEMIWAASKGDLGAIQDQLGRGAALNFGDYDLRTPLHLAAAENQSHVVRYFVDQAAAAGGNGNLSPRDRWGGTPLDDAYQHDNQAIVAILEKAGAERGKARSAVDVADCGGLTPASFESSKVDELIWAASLGDLIAIRRLVAQGVPLDLADYDRRTAIHLAAAEGHVDVVRYCIAHHVSCNPTDRWGNTPLDDAIRHDHQDVAELLRGHGGRARSARSPGG
ncbi:MAG: glutaminase [Alphaproteobacteria bacterium]|jgi:glutaminase|nr:glutaminase [Alphaproteobacteria bacterium]